MEKCRTYDNHCYLADGHGDRTASIGRRTEAVMAIPSSQAAPQNYTHSHHSMDGRPENCSNSSGESGHGREHKPPVSYHQDNYRDTNDHYQDNHTEVYHISGGNVNEHYPSEIYAGNPVETGYKIPTAPLAIELIYPRLGGVEASYYPEYSSAYYSASYMGCHDGATYNQEHEKVKDVLPSSEKSARDDGGSSLEEKRTHLSVNTDERDDINDCIDLTFVDRTTGIEFYSDGSQILEASSVTNKQVTQPRAARATREAFQASSKNGNWKPQATSQIKPQATSPIKPQATSQLKPQATSQLKPQVTSQIKPQATSQLKPQATSQLKPQATSQLKPQATSQLKPQATSQLKPQATSQLKPNGQSNGINHKQPHGQPVLNDHLQQYGQPVLNDHFQQYGQPVLNGHLQQYGQPVLNGHLQPYGQPVLNGQLQPCGQPVLNGQLQPYGQPVLSGHLQPYGQPILNGQLQPYGQPVLNGQLQPYRQPALNGQLQPYGQPALNGQLQPYLQPVLKGQLQANGQPVSTNKSQPYGYHDTSSEIQPYSQPDTSSELQSYRQPDTSSELEYYRQPDTSSELQVHGQVYSTTQQFSAGHEVTPAAIDHQPLPVGQIDKETAPRVPDYTSLSIFVSIFCCLPLGIVGLLKAREAKTLKNQGQYKAAIEKASSSFTANLFAIIFGIIIIGTLVGFFVWRMSYRF